MATVIENRKRIDEDKVAVLVADLQRTLEMDISAKSLIEERMLKDLRQYHGRYPHETENRLKRQADLSGSSTIFVNETRSRCDNAAARVGELLFPTEDRNFTLSPTPDPELSGALQLPIAEIQEAARITQEVAEERAEAMQRLIDDQLYQSDYNSQARDCIRDAVKLGTGILRGPYAKTSTNKRWTPQTASDGSTVHILEMDKTIRPAVRRVSPFDFYPDMAATDLDNCEHFFERKYMSRRMLQQLLEHPAYIRSQVVKVLENVQEGRDANRRNQDIHRRLQEISDVYSTDAQSDSGYEVWTYTGAVSQDMLDAAGIRSKGPDYLERQVEVEFVDGIAIRVALLPLDTEEIPYSAFNWIPADGSVFGFSLATILRAPQEVVNKAWRTMLDNAALSVGPQVVMDKAAVEPSDGSPYLTSRKVWYKKDQGKSVRDVFHAFTIDSTQPQLTEIFNTGQELADQESNMPRLLSGDVGDVPIQTATQTAMLMNAANSFLRSIAKQWDDRITVPLIRRYYDWNMQFHSDPEVKGDMEIKPRGASSLMIKETQTNLLFQLLSMAQTPNLAPLTKFPELYRKVIETMHINPDEIVKSNEQIMTEAQETAQQPTELQQEQQFEAEQNQADRQLDLIMTIIKESGKKEIADEQVEAEILKVLRQEQTKQDEMTLKATVGSGI